MKLISLFFSAAVLIISPKVFAAKGPSLVCRNVVGIVYSGYSKTFYFEVKNDGDEPLDIHEVRTSCNCTDASFKEVVILPGKIVLLPVKYKANKLRGAFELSVSPKTGQVFKVELFSGIVERKAQKGTGNNDTEQAAFYGGI